MLIPLAEYNSLHWNLATTQGLRSLQKAQAARQQPQACRDSSRASPPQKHRTSSAAPPNCKGHVLTQRGKFQTELSTPALAIPCAPLASTSKAGLCLSLPVQDQSHTTALQDGVKQTLSTESTTNMTHVLPGPQHLLFQLTLLGAF